MADNSIRLSASHDSDVISNELEQVSWSSDLSDDPSSLPFDDVDDHARRVATGHNGAQSSSPSSADITNSNVRSDDQSQEVQPGRETITSEPSAEYIHVKSVDQPQEVSQVTCILFYYECVISVWGDMQLTGDGNSPHSSFGCAYNK